jgi:hypothetical protein
MSKKVVGGFALGWDVTSRLTPTVAQQQMQLQVGDEEEEEDQEQAHGATRAHGVMGVLQTLTVAFEHHGLSRCEEVHHSRKNFWLEHLPLYLRVF